MPGRTEDPASVYGYTGTPRTSSVCAGVHRYTMGEQSDRGTTRTSERPSLVNKKGSDFRSEAKSYRRRNRNRGYYERQCWWGLRVQGLGFRF